VARARFPVEILTPEGAVFDEQVEMLSTRTTTGSIGVLANHTPLLAMVDPTELRLYRSQSEIVRFAQGEGYLQVGCNRALLLVEEALRPEALDVGELREKLARAQGAHAAAPQDSEERRKAARDARRWQTFIAIAEGSRA